VPLSRKTCSDFSSDENVRPFEFAYFRKNVCFFSSGFFTLPLLFLAGGVLLAFSIFQAGAYFCTPASLANLSLANGELGMFGFQPWIREYEALA